MLRYMTGVFICLKTCSKTTIFSGYSVRYVWLNIGSVSPWHLPPEFHCPPLLPKKFHCQVKIYGTNNHLGRNPASVAAAAMSYLKCESEYPLNTT